MKSISISDLEDWLGEMPMIQRATRLYKKLLAFSGRTVPRRPPRSSASVVPWRRGGDGTIEVYWVRRSPALDFLGGWHAFPGGGLARGDAAVAVAGAPAGTSETTCTDALPGLADDERRRLGPDLIPGITACALRELFEETGLVLDPGVAADSELAAARRRLLSKEIEFGALAAERGWKLSAAPLVFAGRWLTPPLWPTIRYDNRFFLLEWPADRILQPEVHDGELDDGEWIRPTAALQRWEEGEMIAAPAPSPKMNQVF